MSQAVITPADDERADDAANVNERASVLSHQLAPHFPDLARFRSTRELLASALYARLRPEIERVLDSVAAEDFADDEAGDSADEGARPARLESPPRLESSRRVIRATAWNIERGKRLAGVTRALSTHTDIGASDVLLLTELDYGMARTGNRFVARELARALKLNYAFAPCYVALNKGSGFEARAEGENTLALHGNAVMSRWPLSNVHSIALPNGKDKMRGKEKRIGSQRAVVADVAHPAGTLRVVSLHLDAHSSQKHRQCQMSIVLAHLASLTPRLPTLVGGDWNTMTYNASRATYAIVGFFRRVLMGVRRVMRVHYLHPDRWFERGLFREIERRGFSWRELNAPGAGTLHYHADDLAAHANLGEWVPQWCFWFINWALAKNEGRCSLKLDWFAGRGVNATADNPPRVVGNLRDDHGEPLSDHDPIVLDFVLTND